MNTKLLKMRWFWLAVCTPILVCGAVLLGAVITTPRARAYDAYDYYPGAACNGVYGDPTTAVGILPLGKTSGEEFACPFIRIDPRNTKNKLDFVVFEMDVKTAPAMVRVCARRDDTEPICAVKQAFNTGRQEIVIENADLEELRSSGQYGWDYYLYGVVRLYPGDKLHGYRVYWDGLY